MDPGEGPILKRMARLGYRCGGLSGQPFRIENDGGRPVAGIEVLVCGRKAFGGAACPGERGKNIAVLAASQSQDHYEGEGCDSPRFCLMRHNTKYSSTMMKIKERRMRKTESNGYKTR